MREQIITAARVVVKVGSSSLATPAGELDVRRLRELADVLADRVALGQQVVLVTSGAVAPGIGPLGLPGRPRRWLRNRPQPASGRVAAGPLHRGLPQPRHHGGPGAAHVGRPDEAGALLQRPEHPGVPAVLRRRADRERERHRRHPPPWRQRPPGGSCRASDQGRRGVPLQRYRCALRRSAGPPGSRTIEHVANAEDLEGLVIGGVGSSVGSGGMATKVNAAIIATQGASQWS